MNNEKENMPLWSENYETMFFDIEDYQFRCEGDGEEAEEYLLLMKPVYPQIDITYLIESMSDDGCEDAYEYLENTMNKLGVIDTLKDINTKLKTIPSWYETTKKKIYINEKFEIIGNIHTDKGE